MALIQARLALLLLVWFVKGHSTSDNVLPVVSAAEEWEQLLITMHQNSNSQPGVFYGRSSPSMPPYSPPDFMVVSQRDVQKELFKPDKQTRPLPLSFKEHLLKATAPPPTTAPARQRFEVLCYIDRILIRVRKDAFKQNIIKDLKFGKCSVTEQDFQYYYLRHSMDADCGYQKEYNMDNFIYTNQLIYRPTGLIIRDEPFDQDIHCKFDRFFHSFKRGFYPILRGQTHYKTLQTNSIYTLTPQDELGNEMTSYTLNQLMQFEAANPSMSSGPGNQRLYIDECYVTPSSDPNSPLQYKVIDNYGCFIDSKVSESTFVIGDSPTSQKFVMPAFLFNTGSAALPSQQLYMHCLLSHGSSTPSQIAKACTYDSSSKKWKELHGNDSVCACCETSCPEQSTVNSQPVSSTFWTVAANERPTKTH
ncbi:zona pellucida sperm-binding protein 3-like [Nelusetta ayraudi]|uniref:zona pellucida sperm-binding protein 3-like n=1 Tax=Nelusetta ayraudi TaxID=303726 RepID=UPI003F6EF0EB